MTRAVERALAIFDAFDAEHQILTLQQIGERIAMPKATTFRLVNTLQGSGFLMRLEGNRYCLSLKLLRLAGLVRNTISVRDVARPIMLEVSEKTGETITLNTRSGMERICIDVVDTPASLMTIVRPGEHVSLLFGATARLLLAYLPDEEIDRVIAATPAARGIDAATLKRELATIRRQGWARTSAQRVAGVTAIAVPLSEATEDVRYSLALTGPSVRVDPRRDEFTTVMCEAGRQISLLMGGTFPPARPRASVPDRPSGPHGAKSSRA
jgi:DNA-binding IclR family transcriptional regulator